MLLKKDNMNTHNTLKKLVQEKYSEIANQSIDRKAGSCCGATACCSEDVYHIMADDYTRLEGYFPDADLGLGCGLPTAFAAIKEGDTVIDLGSGAGNDCFVARKLTGEKGKVIGIDFTDAMIEKARMNADKLGFVNVEFRKGDIEKMPVGANVADVVISNCVLNLVPDKYAVFSEIYRVLKPGGHFSISDIVLEGELPEKWRRVTELYAGCITGAVQQQVYLEMIQGNGFENIRLQKKKEVQIPDEILLQYMSREEADAFKASGTKIKSITVYAEKPAGKTQCVPGGGCC